MKRAGSLGLAALVAGLVLLAGCGNAGTPAADAKPKSPTPAGSTSSPATPSTAPKPKPLPRCSDIWVADKRLPGGYHGCAPAGPLPKADQYYCESGQVLVTFQNHFFAARTGRIFHSDDVRHDSRWHEKLTTCRG